MKNNVEINNVVRKALFRTRGNAKPKYFNVDVIPADFRLEYEELLRDIDVKERLANFIRENQYTWVLVDMPPSNHKINEICFTQIVDFVVIPFSSDYFSLKGYASLIETIARARELNSGLKLIGIYLSRYTENCAVDKYIKEKMTMFGYNFMDVCIPVRTDIREAVMYGRPISYYQPNSPSNKAFVKLVNVIERRIKSAREQSEHR